MLSEDFTLTKYGISYDDVQNIYISVERIKEFTKRKGATEVQSCTLEIQKLIDHISPVVLKISKFHMYPKNQWDTSMPKEFDEFFQLLSSSIIILRELISRSERDISTDIFKLMMSNLKLTCPLSPIYTQDNFYRELITICGHKCNASDSIKICDEIRTIISAKSTIDSKLIKTAKDYENYFEKWRKFFDIIGPFLFTNYLLLSRVNISNCLRQWFLQEINLHSSMYLQMMKLKGVDNNPTLRFI